MTEPASTVRALNCPGCGGAIELRAQGFTVNLVCGHCRATLDMTQDTPSLIARAAGALATPWLQLGWRGSFDGVEWEIVGYLERASNDGRWAEYLLFNPYHGFRFLVDDRRCWSIGQLLDRHPTTAYARWVEYGGRNFEQFDVGYDARVTFVVGEFYWRVAVGDTVCLRDYVRPGTMLSREESGSEIQWTRLDYLAPGVVENAFGVERRKKAWGRPPSPHEPSPHWPLFGQAFAVMIVALLALCAALTITPARSMVATTDVEIPIDEKERTLVIGPLDLPYRSARVEISADAPALDNQWLDLDYTLVDKRTQAEVSAYGLAEYYRGVDNDGSWSEGDVGPRTQLSGVARGRYDLVVDIAGHRWAGGTLSSLPEGAPIPLRLIVTTGGNFTGNVILALFLIAGWPLWLVGAHFLFESRRRRQSSFYES